MIFHYFMASILGGSLDRWWLFTNELTGKAVKADGINNNYGGTRRAAVGAARLASISMNHVATAVA